MATCIAKKGDVAEAMEGRLKISAHYAVAPALHALIDAHRKRRLDGDRLRLWSRRRRPPSAATRLRGQSDCRRVR